MIDSTSANEYMRLGARRGRDGPQGGGTFVQHIDTSGEAWGEWEEGDSQLAKKLGAGHDDI